MADQEGTSPRRNRAAMSKLAVATWFKQEDKHVTKLGRGRIAYELQTKGMPQYRLYAFIDKHFDGNVSKAAKFAGFLQPNLFKILDTGRYGKVTAERIVSAFRKIDENITEAALFIPPKLIKVPPKPRKRDIILPPAIKPSMGSVRSVGLGAFSQVLERVR